LAQVESLLGSRYSFAFPRSQFCGDFTQHIAVKQATTIRCGFSERYICV
jgi:hypothetical protein